MKKIILTLVLLIFIVSAAILTRVGMFVFTSVKIPEKVVIDVPPGSAFYPISEKLGREGVVSNARAFRYLAFFLRKVSQLRVGEYEFEGQYTPKQVLDVLVSGKSKLYKITFQEGINIYEIAELLDDKNLVSKEEILRLNKDKSFIQEVIKTEAESLEGYLFPETYYMSKYTGAKSILSAMVENFWKVHKELEINKFKKMSLHDLITLASVIEKETGAPEERPLIASVFYNRLKKRMRLQSDPTIIYGILDKTGSYTKNITKKDIQAYTKYNTYKVPALPFGPIANPGKEALKAVLHPEKTDYLYFVSRNDGTHYFSKTYREHTNAVRRFQLDRKARQGKSWRDLKTKK